MVISNAALTSNQPKEPDRGPPSSTLFFLFLTFQRIYLAGF